MLYFTPKGRTTDISLALDYLNKVTRRKTVSFVISDFFQSREKNNNNLKKTLAIANKRHDLVAITLNDPREIELSDCGLLQLEDAETGEQTIIDSSDPGVRKEYDAAALKRINNRAAMFGSAGVDHIDVSTDRPFIQEIVKFFLQRRRRRWL